MKKWMVRLAAAVLLLIIVSWGFVRWDRAYETAEAQIAAMPRIDSEAALTEALQAPAQRYVVQLPLSGEGTAYDRFHLLRGEYLNIHYICQTRGEEDWSANENRSSDDWAESVTLPGNVPLDLSGVEVKALGVTLDEAHCLYTKDIYQGAYYPGGYSSNSTVRYSVAAIAKGDKALFMAEISPKGVQIVAPDKGKTVLLINSKLSDLTYYATENDTAVLVLVLLPLFLLDLWLWGTGVRKLFRGE